MPFSLPIDFTDTSSAYERQKILSKFQNEMFEVSMSEIKRMTLQKLLNYANAELINIKLNVLGQRRVEAARFKMCSDILNMANLPDMAFVKFVQSEVNKITNLRSVLRKSLNAWVRFVGSPQQNKYINQKIKDFDHYFMQLSEYDMHSSVFTLIPTVGLYLLTRVPAVATLLIAGMAVRFNTTQRRKLIDTEQALLNELYDIYLWATMRGASATRFPCVMALAETLAPFISTRKLIHWNVKLNLQGYESHAFISLLRQPPHNLRKLSFTPTLNLSNVMATMLGNDIEQEFVENLQQSGIREEAKLSREFGFWQNSVAEVKRIMYGIVEEDATQLQRQKSAQ